MFDLATITPRESKIDIVSAHGVESKGRKKLPNPFRAKSSTSPKQEERMDTCPFQLHVPNSQGTRGYLLVNDDAMLKTWDLPEDVLFGERPWGTFVPSQCLESNNGWVRRQIMKRYPYGNRTGWSWYNYDSGSVLGKKISPVQTSMLPSQRSMRFAATKRCMDHALHKRFCVERAQKVVSPLCTSNGKADIFFMFPAMLLGLKIQRA